MSKINYIIAFYIGNRMHSVYSNRIAENPYYFLEKHIDFLNNSTTIDLITFVFNVDNIEQQNIITKYITNSSISFPLEVLFRPNNGFSYGAWNHAIIKNINDFDYYFINEDDYIPINEQFYVPFINELRDNIAYVPLMILDNIKRHAAFSCGALSGKACKRVLQQNNTIFNVLQTNSYFDAYKTQLNFYDYFIDMGYDFCDLIDKYCLPYMDSSKNKITYYGDKNSDCILIPVGFDEYQ